MTAAAIATGRATSTASLVRAGLIGGAIAGMVFAMFEMLAAVAFNGPDAFFMPLRMIAGIALGPSAMDPSTSLALAGAVGLGIHMALSMMYGVATAIVANALPVLSRSTGALVVFATVMGLALWILNFFVLARVLGWSWFPDGQNVAVQVIDRLAFRPAR